jgi:hypothetical protein
MLSAHSFHMKMDVVQAKPRPTGFVTCVVAAVDYLRCLFIQIASEKEKFLLRRKKPGVNSATSSFKAADSLNNEELVVVVPQNEGEEIIREKRQFG